MIGEIIRSERKKKHISINKLATQVGMSQGYLSSIENGKNPSDEILEKIAEALEIPAIRIRGVSIVNRIAKLLSERGLSFEDLAKGLDLKKEYLENLDAIVPWHEDYDVVQRIAEHLGVSSKPLMAALTLQEPPDYDDTNPISAEEAFKDEAPEEALIQEIKRLIGELPYEALVELRQYADFLKAKYSKK